MFQGNHNADAIKQRCSALDDKLRSLQEAANTRKGRLIDNSAFLQFIWKTDVVESWIGKQSLDLLYKINHPLFL